MEPVAIYLKEDCDLSRAEEPMSFGIPLPCSQLWETNRLRLLNPVSGEPITACFTPLCHWHDGSVRWVLTECLIALKAEQSQTLLLKNEGLPKTTGSYFEKANEGWVVQTRAGNYFLNRRQPTWELLTDNESTVTRAQFTSQSGTPGVAIADCDWQLHQHGEVYVQAMLEGHWQATDKASPCRFTCQLRIYLETGVVDVEFRIHNPNRSKHPGGLWDLGDEGSIYFQSLELITKTTGDAVTLQPDVRNNPEHQVNSADVYLYQDSSGGENWNSRNHIDKDGQLTTHFQGYKLQAAIQASHTGKRANPKLTIEGCNALQIAMPGFWQNFPSSLSYKDGTAIAGLFPTQPNKQCYELQGGERKTLRCLFSYSNSDSDLAWAYAPIIPTLDASLYESAGAFPWFKAGVIKDALDELIQEGLDGPNNFFAKREIIDEYGWRNFGDVFADHESLYQPQGAAPLISHYNNQYDAIYGFARQFAMTGDRRWFELMDDLARHVVDIDIYHTEEDRAEYNNGLFWHTDHYLDAHTATHRTFSRHNSSSSTPGQTGGGPAEEHCYTTGLLYHYFLTGNDASRKAVLELADWMTNLHEGSGTFLEQLLRIKRYDVPRIQSLLTRNTPTSHVYPFNRGTGNYLNTLLDAHLLEPEAEWLKKAESVIYGTLHPQDRISDRKLLVAESGWSYLVLVAAVSRFLLLKEERRDFGGAYHYALASFLHYTRWMLFNEQTFLSHPKELEFANDTWAAQDFRKAMIFFQAASRDPEKADQYRERALDFLGYVLDKLQQSPEKTLARVQIILLQNYGPHLGKMPVGHETWDGFKKQQSDMTSPVLTWPSLFRRIVGRLVKGLVGFKLKKERDWLATRLERP